jgi:hypothetical protein
VAAPRQPFTATQSSTLAKGFKAQMDDPAFKTLPPQEQQRIKSSYDYHVQNSTPPMPQGSAGTPSAPSSALQTNQAAISDLKKSTGLTR